MCREAVGCSRALAVSGKEEFLMLGCSKRLADKDKMEGSRKAKLL